MPRNGSGTYSVPTSFSPNTTIASAAVNGNLSDIGSEITGSLPRDGQAGMTGQFKAANGTAALPGIAFGADTDTGFFRKSGNTIGVSAGGAEVFSFDANGLLDALGVKVSGIPTGSIMHFGALTAPTGWVRMNARTIGSATSGATERANADTESLFSFLWTNYSDTVCPVTGGRGASAAADWAANKVIALPDVRGRALFGLDDMGGTASGRLATATIEETTNGANGGADTVTLARANLPNDNVTVTIDEHGGHSHTVNGFTGNTQSNLGNGGSAAVTTPVNPVAQTALTGITASFRLNGNVTQAVVDKMPPAFLTTFIMKL